MIDVQGISKSFGGVHALRDASFTLKEGSITGLIGPNGAGKTTLFDCITGFQKPDSGTIHLRGQRIDGLPPHRITHMGIGRTFQLVRLLPRLSALENLLVAHPGHRGETLAGALFGGWQADEDAATQTATKWLERVGMLHRKDVPGGQLSYGQSKLVELARVLSLETDVILLDEPMSGINPTLRADLLKTIHKIREEHGKTILIIEHDIEMIMSECDSIVVMDHGQIITHGTPEQVKEDPRVVEAYLGTGRKKFTAMYEEE